MGMISQFGPIRFNETAGGNYEVNSHAKNSATLGLKSSFVQEFKDKAETIYFEDAISGAYGFSSISEFNTSGALNPRIFDCQICIDSGFIVYNSLGPASTGDILAIRLNGDVSIDIRESLTVIDTVTASTGLFLYPLTQDYVGLTVKITSVDELCVSAVMLCEPSIPYTFCGFENNAKLIGISPFGGAYLITSDIQWYELNNVVAEQLNVYSFDFSIFSPEIPSIDYRIKIGTETHEFLTAGPSIGSIEIMNGFIDSFDWIKTSVDGLVLTVTLPAICGAVSLLVYENDALRDTHNFTLDETFVDEDFVYTNNDANIDTIEGIQVIINSFGGLQTPTSLWFMNNGFVGSPMEIESGIYYETDGSIIDASDEGSIYPGSAYIQLSKAGKIFNSCCAFVVENLTSEPVSIVEETDKRLIQYSDTQFRQGLLANFEHNLWLDCNLRRTAGSQTNSFVGEKRDYVLKGRVSLNRELQTKEAIPDYLCEILEGSMNCDSFKIDGVLYAKTDEPAFEYVDDNVLLCEFSAEIRKSE